MNRSEGTFQVDADLELYYQYWLPAGQPKAALAIVHGVAEHSDRYSNVVNNLIQEDFAIFAYDQRGHGKSPGQRGYLDSWEQYRSDFNLFLDLIQETIPGLPVFVYGHSQGALIILDYLARGKNTIAGAVVSGSPLASDDAASPLLVVAAKVLSRVWPTFSLETPINPAQLSCDARVVKKYQDDPTVFKILTARWGTEYLKTQDYVRENASQIKTPILILHGGEDSLCDPKGSQDLYEKVSTADKSLKIYPSYFHEIHNEPGHITVIQDINQWISERLNHVSRTNN